MSDLQLSLLAIGAVVIGVVYLYNRLQERSLRRRLRQAFGDVHEDVLLEAGAESVRGDRRLEPQLAMAVTPPREEGTAVVAERPADEGPASAIFDPALDYIAEIAAQSPIADALVGELLSKIASCGKPAHIAALDPRRGAWEDVVRGAGARYTKLRLALQLADRAGPVNAAQLAAFCDAVRHCADKIPAPVRCPDPQAALKIARDLDAFCAKVDVAIGVNVVAPEGKSFAGTQIRALAESAGFKLESDGMFHCRGAERQTLFTLDNHEPAPFLPESIKGISTSGLTLLLDVPRVADGVAVLDRMLEISQGLAAALGGRLVDDNRAALSAAGISRIKEQVRSIQAAMAARGVPAGGARALRLFS